jgi:hypothetical protein
MGGPNWLTLPDSLQTFGGLGVNARILRAIPSNFPLVLLYRLVETDSLLARIIMQKWPAESWHLQPGQLRKM